ncbi:hypothetical protein TYRP_017875 [Tyrophagus putrescentiae]|nr:hypothetical protein TYRP_017875 [Tyrophagus putrescentiae]
MKSVQVQPRRPNSLSLSGILCLAVLIIACLVLLLEPANGQITFSKDWRAGGKRSGSAALTSHGISVLDVPCDQLAEYSSTKIRDLVRREAVALLQCEFNVNNKNELVNTKK